MGVAAPAFGEGEAMGERAHFAAHLLHSRQIGIHPLADIEPFFLRAVLRKHVALLRQHRADINELPGLHQAAQAVAQAVRLGVIERQYRLPRVPRGAW